MSAPHADLIPSGPSAPSITEVAKNMASFEFEVNQVVIVFNVDVKKDGKIVQMIPDASLTKFEGTLNPAYAEQFMKDVINDFKIGFAQSYYRKLQEQAAAAQGNKGGSQ